MSKTIFELHSISKSYGKHTVLKNINLTIKEGEIVSLVGLNGQGKSTLVKIILGLVKPTKGKVTRNVQLKKDVGVMLQEIEMPENMRVDELLSFLQFFSEEVMEIDYYLNKVDLTEDKNSFCTKLSGGKQRRLQYASAIVGAPKVLILDEPTVGMDVISKGNFWLNIQNMIKDKEITVLLISHDLEEVEKYSSRVIFLNQGEIISDRLMEELSLEFDENKFLIISETDVPVDIADKLKRIAFKIENSDICISNDRNEEVMKLFLNN
ncbi:TPA: ABC transporter ATP-binding protein, partial [Bacillus cytotoxicus]|nr:ABC transporter ATP-binding protein [Bacillus cytotoxicus]